jgi:diguanylate cyclase (GGDEF)-like protein
VIWITFWAYERNAGRGVKTDMWTLEDFALAALAIAAIMKLLVLVRLRAERQVAREALRAEVEQRRLAEDALRELISSLESVVQERTALLSAAVEEVAHAKGLLEELAQHDSLTGLPNRRLLLDRLKQAIANGRRRGGHVGVLFIDLDRFKAINDTLGHDAGDELLKEVARRLSGCVREGDTVSREGGDEFVLVLPDLEVREDARRVADKALAELGKPVMIGAHETRVTPSIGVSYYPDDASDPQELLKCADDAMYRAKDAGRNAVRLFSAESQRVS